MDRENALRVHIRKLLLPYALTHLTTNYVEHSQSEAAKLLSESLDVVPMQDPTFLALSMEPFDAFCSLYRLEELSAYMELWKIDIEARDFLIKALGSISAASKLPTNSYLELDEDSLLLEPMSTVLTRQAICETPQLGKQTLNQTKDISTPSMLSNTIGLEMVSEEYISPTAISPKERETLLGIRYSINKEFYEPVTQLVNHIAGVDRRAKDMVDEFDNDAYPSRTCLRGDSPQIYGFQEHMSPPIFPIHKTRHSQVTGPERPSDIQSLGFIKKVESINDEDIAKEHMRVINGWTVMPEISSDTPSLGSSSQTTEFDELFAVTPPQRPVSPKMDPYLIPRVYHPGADLGNKSKNEKQNLFEFISPLLPEMRAIPSSDSIEHQPSSHRQEIPSSILGQPPSPLGSRTTIANDMRRDELLARNKHVNETPKRLGELIDTLCVSVRDEHPEDWILSERLEEKESLMMEVPKMKEPYIQSPSPSCPVTPQTALSLVISKNAKIGSSAEPSLSTAILKKVSGLQSLNIELSWRPFNFGSRIPTAEELTNTESFFPTIASDLNVDTLEEGPIKNYISFMESSKEINDKTESVDDLTMEFTNTFGGDYDIALTNADRRKIYHSDGGNIQEIMDTASLETPTDDKSGDPTLTGQAHKRLRIISPPLINTFDMENEPSVSGQNNAALETASPRLLSPEIDNIQHPLTQGSNVFDITARNNGGVFGNIDLPKETRLDHEKTNVTLGDPILGDFTSVDHAPSGRKSATVSLTGRNGSLANNSSRPSGQQILAPAKQALQEYLHLRARGRFVVNDPEPLRSSSPPSQEEQHTSRAGSTPPDNSREIPSELLDANTVILPSDWTSSTTRLRFIASVNVLQKTVLLEYLDFHCHIDLAERENTETHGADLILDVDTAVLFVPLSSLHLTKEKLAERIASLSWRFNLITVVFEAFSTATALRYQRLNEGNLTPYAFPPITIKAIKTLKRLLTIMEIMQSQTNERATVKSPNTIVNYAYARDVLEAAKFTRLVGDQIGVSNTEWLSDEYTQDEKDLSHIPGMNIYAAAVLLRYIDVNLFVDMSPTERIGRFSNILGEKRVMILNDEIETRLAILANSSSPVTAVPLVEDAPYETEYR